MNNLNGIALNSKRLLVCCLLPLFLGALSCDDESADDSSIFLAAQPSSIVLGESTIAVITSAEPFFTADLGAPLVSEGGLSLESISRTSDTEGSGVFVSTMGTIVGNHRFFIEIDGVEAILDIAVLKAETGAGVVTAEETVASAGAKLATINLIGAGTQFDNSISVEMRDVPDFQIDSVSVHSEQWIELVYSIPLSQAPLQTQLVVKDGAYSYEVPFSIISPKYLESTPQVVALTRGQVGTVTLSHPNANLNFGTQLMGLPTGVESAIDALISIDSIDINVRVPDDFSESTLALTAHSYLDGGAILEVVTSTVNVLEPAYIAAIPSQLAHVGEQTLVLSSKNLNFKNVKSIAFEENDFITLSDWEAQSETEAELSFVVSDTVAKGVYAIFVDDGDRVVESYVLVPGVGNMGFVGPAKVAAGDRLFLPILTQGASLFPEDITLVTDPDGDIQVVGVEYIDENAVIAEIKVDPYVAAGEQGIVRQVILQSGDNSYTAGVKIVSSGL